MKHLWTDNPDILFEDNHLIVALKPAGILSQPDRTGHPDLQTMLKRFVAVRDHKPGDAFIAVVHSLDRMVGGLMLFAKTSKAAGRLSDQFRRHVIDKYYLAVTHGAVEADAALWRDMISTKSKGGRYFITGAMPAKEARLYACGLAGDAERDMSLVAFKLITGRSHQIRVQSSHRGYALVGDRRYGAMLPADRRTPSVNLFAAALALDHPVTGGRLLFYAPPPLGLFFDDFAETLKTLDGRALAAKFAQPDSHLV
jgi:23S rRNA pseudouridine1911/1915/1917 synthase